MILPQSKDLNAAVDVLLWYIVLYIQLFYLDFLQKFQIIVFKKH